MTSLEKLCREAYKSAMQVPSIRRALDETGRATYRSGSADMAGLMPIPDLFSITKIDVLTSHDEVRSVVMVNGHEVDCVIRKALEPA